MQTVKNPEVFARKAEAIYNRKYRAVFESKYRGQIAAIDIQSEEAFLGKTERDAFDKAHKKHPDRVFFFLRVGYRAAQRITSPYFHKLPAK
jgi:hypothetical protein